MPFGALANDWRSLNCSCGKKKCCRKVTKFETSNHEIFSGKYRNRSDDKICVFMDLLATDCGLHYTAGGAKRYLEKCCWMENREFGIQLFCVGRQARLVDAETDVVLQCVAFCLWRE